MNIRILVLFVAVLCQMSMLHAQWTTMVPAGSVWKYLDTGTDPGSSWITPGYNDSSWPTGSAELGYGDGDENTTVSYGPSSSSKYITTYLRHTFTVVAPGAYTYLKLSLLRDDGAVVYVNGTEVVRSNMPSGAIGYLTGASSTVALIDESTYYEYYISSSLLVTGNNTLAVEVHQVDASSSDISFNLKLEGTSAPLSATVLRGPYLQSLNPAGVTICWRTDVPSDSRVRVGTSPGAPTIVATDPVMTTEHQVTVTGLDPYTFYYYDFGTISAVLGGGTASHRFRTSPLTGTEGKYRFWVIGDAGTNNGDQESVRDAYYTYTGTTYTDGWLMLGDNAYNSGTDAEYQDAVFQGMYENMLIQTCLWPTPGNHDYYSGADASTQTGPYYDIFHLPKTGVAGGVPSGTEAYYAYNFGNIHFISLDSYDSGRDSTNPMATWLKADLAANTQPWVIAYWHHPPYTKGSHDSDNPFPYLDGELPEIREQIIPILERYGVDLVLCGHSHCYERSRLIDGHYGSSSSYVPGIHDKDGGSGSYPVSCPYEKTTLVKSHQGTVYAVVGCSGKHTGTSSGWPHPIMHAASNTVLGSMILDIEGLRLDAKFLSSTGSIWDQFTMVKDVNRRDTITICPGDTALLIPSWPGDHTWSPGSSTADTLVVTPPFTTTYYVADPAGCLRDTFRIVVLPSGAGPCAITGVNDPGLNRNEGWMLFPNPLRSGLGFTLTHNGELSHGSTAIKVTDISGRVVWENVLTVLPGSNSIEIPSLPLFGGQYLMSIIHQDFIQVIPFIIQ